jgi:DNA-binding transcriptional regulator LsrR (DeoR family)
LAYPDHRAETKKLYGAGRRRTNQRAIARAPGMARKTVKKYLAEAIDVGLGLVSISAGELWPRVQRSAVEEGVAQRLPLSATRDT